MHKHHVRTVWAGGVAFDSHLGKHVVRIDGHPEPEEKTGTGPKALLLTALTGCSGIDIAMIMDKMRQPYESIEIEAEADLTDEHPKVYSEIRVTFRVSGKNLNEERVRHAVELSMTKYCGVATMLRAHCPIDYAVEVIEEFQEAGIP